MQDQNHSGNEEKNSAIPSGKVVKDSSLNAAPSFTKGPWYVQRGAYNLISDLSVWPVGESKDGDERIACWIRTPADARLIAAAPIMYEALQAAERFIKDTREQPISRIAHLDTIRAALALAGGQSTSEPEQNTDDEYKKYRLSGDVNQTS